jgi:hypothetical protein
MPRRSSRILNRDGKKFDNVVRQIHRETSSFVHGGFTPLERSHKIKHVYNIIYDSRELFHMYTNEEFIVKFMKKYIEQGKIILETSDTKSHANVCRAAILRTSKYAEKYLKARDIMIRRAAYKIAQKTCVDVSKKIISFL